MLAAVIFHHRTTDVNHAAWAVSDLSDLNQDQTSGGLLRKEQCERTDVSSEVKNLQLLHERNVETRKASV